VVARVTARFLDYDTLAPGDLNPAALLTLLPDLVLHTDTTEDELEARLADASIVMVNKIRLTAGRIARAPRLRFICRRWPSTSSHWS
jgi:glycerate dehydrogenase